jgi:hypothetical protein
VDDPPVVPESAAVVPCVPVVPGSAAVVPCVPAVPGSSPADWSMLCDPDVEIATSAVDFFLAVDWSSELHPAIISEKTITGRTAVILMIFMI